MESKIWHRWTILQNIQTHRHRKQCYGYQSGRLGGVKRYTLLYIKEINNKVLLYSTGSCIWYIVINLWGFPGSSMLKESSCSAGDAGDTGWVPWLGGSPGGLHGNPLQYACLENPRDKGAWKPTVHRVAKSQTWLKQLSMHTCMQ